MTEELLQLTRADDVAVLTINRPEKRNALHEPLWTLLEERATELANEPPRAVILTGTGAHFSAGMDLSFDNPLLARLAPKVMEKDEQALEELVLFLKRVINSFTLIPCPVIAAIEGACVGGGMELALACDLRVSSTGAFFSLPEAKAGMMPDLGGTVRSMRLVGQARATDLVLTGRSVPAEEAERWGIVDRLCPPGEALQTARKLAADLRQSGPATTRNLLTVLRADLSEAFALETKAAVRVLVSGECVEGIRAFVEKRPPTWAEPTE